MLMMGFEHLVPGWSNKVAHPYHLPIEAGLRVEMERLKGSRFVVVVLTREYDYSGLHEVLVLDSGFVDPMEAVEYAERLRKRECQGIARENSHWRCLESPAREWPARDPKAGKMLRLEPAKYGDGTGYNSWEIHVAVVPITPSRPLTADLLSALAQPLELNAHFRDIGKLHLGAG